VHIVYLIYKKKAWLRQLVPGLPLWRPEFNPRAVNVEFLVDRLAVEHVFLWVGICPVIVILPTLHLHSSATNTNGVATMWVLHISGADCSSCL